MSTVYPKAPIVEAVIDLRMRGTTKLDVLGSVGDKLKEHYAVRENLNNVDVEVDANHLGLRHSVVGLRLASIDQADVLILNAQGITTSRLAPYQGWETLQEIAQRNYAAWRKAGADCSVARVGVRFINRLDIPLAEPREFAPGDYVKLVVTCPDNLPAGRFLSFSAQVRFEALSPLWVVQINGGVVAPSPLVGHKSLLLDIDVLREREIPSAAQKLWSVIEEAREIKNNIFEAFITDGAREMFR